MEKEVQVNFLKLSLLGAGLCSTSVHVFTVWLFLWKAVVGNDVKSLHLKNKDATVCMKTCHCHQQNTEDCQFAQLHDVVEGVMSDHCFAL